MHYNFTGSVAPELPVESVSDYAFRVRLHSGSLVSVRNRQDVGMYAPDLNVIALVRYGYHGEGADSDTTLLHLVSGATFWIPGFIESTPSADLLLVNESGALYEGGTLAIIRVSESDFERLGGHSVGYSFFPAWVSPACVEFRGSPQQGAEVASLVQDSDGRWRGQPSPCQ